MVMIMKSLCFVFVILASFVALFSVADARRFNVGGNGVWAINPQENYNTWAERNRFQVNDTLYFKYAKGSDSVQQVMKADFDGCNVRNPIKNSDNGESEITLDRSGPFYFISGNQDHCKKGQKLIVVVLAVRNHHPKVPISPAKPPSMAQPPKSHSPVSPAKSPSTAQPPKSHSPVAPAKPPTMAQSPKSPSPVAPVKPPTMAQPPKSSIAPASSPQPPKTPSPISHSPAASPSHAPSVSPKSPSPASSPSHAPSVSPSTPSPSPKSLSPASSPSTSPSSPKSPSPAASPSADQTPASPSPDQTPIAPSPEQTTPSSPSPADSTPASDNIMAPAPSPKSSASGVAVTSVMTTLSSMACIVFMLA